MLFLCSIYVIYIYGLFMLYTQCMRDLHMCVLYLILSYFFTCIYIYTFCIHDLYAVYLCVDVF